MRECGLASRLVVLAEPEIAPGDCRIEWADGGITRDSAATEHAIDEAVARYIDARLTAPRNARNPLEVRPMSDEAKLALPDLENGETPPLIDPNAFGTRVRCGKHNARRRRSGSRVRRAGESVGGARRARMEVGELLKLGPGAVLELDRKVGEAIDIYVNDRLVARGEVVLVEDKLGVTMTEIIKAERN